MKTRAPLSRRTLLKGVGASLALPLLDGMRPALAAASKTPAAPVRLAWVFFANGTNYSQWKPDGEGADWRPSPTLEPLADLRSELLVLSGLAQINAESLGDGPGDHARSAAAFLTGAHPHKTSGAGLRAGVSADQVAAQFLGRSTKLPSLELGTERGRSAGNCDSGYSCAYSNNIAWRSASQPALKEINPRLAFERLFGDEQGGAARAERLARRRSVLDFVSDQAIGLRRRLGQSDRNKLEEYFQSVREVEKRIDFLSDNESDPAIRDELASLQAPPDGEPEDLTEHIRLMYDLMLLAFQTDTTRVATFMLANEGSNRRYSLEGVRGGHHELSHHQNRDAKMAQIAKIDRYLIEQYAYFIKRMKETREGEGALLDNCAILYGGAISDGNRHDHHDLPVVVAGRAGGAFSPGRHVRMSEQTPLCNLFLSMLDAGGAQVDSFGDSTGPLAGLRA